MRQVTVTEKYRAVQEGKMAKKEFVRQMRQQFPMHITQFNGFNDSVQILKNRGLLFESSKENVKAKQYDDRPALTYSLDALDRGIRYELSSVGIDLGTEFNRIQPEDFLKAEKKAKDNLEKNPTHYLDLISGESNNVDKHDREVPVKRGEGKVDVFNGMKKADLREARIMLKEGRLEDLAKRLGVPVDKLKAAADKIRDMEKEKAQRDAMKVAKMKEVIDEIDEDVPFRKIYSADFNEIRKYLENKIDAQVDGHVLDGVLHELFESAEVLRDEQRGTSELDAVYAVAENLEEQYEEEGKDEELQIAKKIVSIIEPIVMSSENKNKEEAVVEKTPILKEVLASAIGKIKERYGKIPGINSLIKDFVKTHAKDIMDGADPIDEFDNFVSVNYDSLDEVDEAKTIDVFGNGDVVIDISNATPEQERVIRYELEISEFEDAVEAQKVADRIMSLNSEDDVETYYSDERGWGQDDDFAPMIRHAIDAYRGINEGEKKDHDGDGDIDSDDYMAAKDKAIKKAMGKEKEANEELELPNSILNRINTDIKNPKTMAQSVLQYIDAVDDKEQPALFKNQKLARALAILKDLADDPTQDFDKNVDKATSKLKSRTGDIGIDEAIKKLIKKVLKEDTLNEAATNSLAALADSYGGFKGMQVILNDLENIVTDIESYHARTQEKLQSVFNKVGQVENEEGLKVGGFLAPAIEAAFIKDLKPVTRKGYMKGVEIPKVKFMPKDVPTSQMEEEPKQTVFGVNEEKK